MRCFGGYNSLQLQPPLVRFYQKQFRAIEGNFSLRKNSSESHTDKQRTGGGKDPPRFELGT